MKKVILVADDSATIRKFVSVALKLKGYDIVAASDGMEAMEKLVMEDISLIITDLNMPNMDGFELIRSVRSSDEYKNLPIIILSSLSKNEEVEEGLKSGANSYLIKPFDQKRILYEVSKFLN